VDPSPQDRRFHASGGAAARESALVSPAGESASDDLTLGDGDHVVDSALLQEVPELVIHPICFVAVD
jgi:hypothetical protein